MYDRYCKNYDRAIELYQAMMEEQDFVSAEEAQRTKWGMRVGGLLLSDFLIKPVQRICKYPLLFKALIGYTSEDHSDMPLLKKADAAMNKAAEEVNRARADQKSAQDMKTIDESLEGFTGGSIIVPGRYLLRAGPLVKLSPSGGKQERHFFLFSDMIMYVKKNKKTYEYKDHVDLVELSVRAPEKGQTKGLAQKDLDCCFELVRQDSKKKKVYTIIADTVQSKTGWMASLSDAIATANRRKQTVNEDAVQQLESRIGIRKRGETEQAGPNSGRTFSLFGTARGKGAPRAMTLGEESASVDATGIGDEAVLNAIKSIRAQVADTNKLLAQAKDLHAKLTEKVDVMQRMVDLESKARLELEERVEKLEAEITTPRSARGQQSAQESLARSLPATNSVMAKRLPTRPKADTQPLFDDDSKSDEPLSPTSSSTGEFRVPKSATSPPKSPLPVPKTKAPTPGDKPSVSPRPQPRPTAPPRSGSAPKKPLPSVKPKPVEDDQFTSDMSVDPSDAYATNDYMEDFSTDL